MSKDADRARTRALRLLAREHYAEYAGIYEHVRPAAPDRYQARNRARMQLRDRYPGRYMELRAHEQAASGAEVPAGIRSKSWQRATGRLADLRAPAYRESFARFRAQGMNRPAAYDRAMAVLREADSDLFTRMLTEEYQLWLAVDPAGTPGAWRLYAPSGGARPAGRCCGGRAGSRAAWRRAAVTRLELWPQPGADAGALGGDGVNGTGRAREMRRELGRRLREAAGLSQQQVAKRVGYTRSAVSNAEAGGYARRRFWEMCDELFGTGGVLACRYDEIHQRPASQPGLAGLERDADGPGLEMLHGARDPASAALALAGYRKLGWPMEESRGGLALVTGTVIDALEVTRPAGTLAAAWWLYTGGAADEIRGLPALPRPDQALAVVDAGPSLFFLAQAGGPWNARDVPDRAPGPAGMPAVRWHCLGSRIPMPPSAAADGQAAAWAHLPAGRLRLAPAIGLLDLLAKAAATAQRDVGRLAFPGGVVVIPVPGPHSPPPAP